MSCYSTHCTRKQFLFKGNSNMRNISNCNTVTRKLGFGHCLTSYFPISFLTPTEYKSSALNPVIFKNVLPCWLPAGVLCIQNADTPSLTKGCSSAILKKHSIKLPATLLRQHFPVKTLQHQIKYFKALFTSYLFCMLPSAGTCLL